MYQSKINEGIPEGELLRYETNCAENACKELCTAHCRETCEQTCCANEYW